jgi:hypothetical protein
MRRCTCLVAAIAIVAALAGGVVWAGVPDAAGVIHACTTPPTGRARVADSDAGTPPGCTAPETGLTWNATGSAGEAGAPGANGSPGNDGPSGAPGRIVTDVESRLTSFYTSDAKSLQIDCLAGMQVIGRRRPAAGWRGHHAERAAADGTRLVRAGARDDAAGPDVPWQLVGHAICASVN